MLVRRSEEVYHNSRLRRAKFSKKQQEFFLGEDMLQDGPNLFNVADKFEDWGAGAGITVGLYPLRYSHNGGRNSYDVCRT